MKFLITGVAGLLGSNMAAHLIDKGHEVIGVDNLSGGWRENVPNGVIFREMSCDDKNMEEIFMEFCPDYVYHFAAYAAEGLSPFIRTFNYTNNLVATANIVNCCVNHNVKRLIFTSSMAVYGPGNPPFSEIHRPDPYDPYGVAKYACEMDIQIAGEQHGLDWCVIRPHNVYGPGQNIWDKYRNVLGIWMRQYIGGEAFTVFGDGSQCRAFSYISDMMEPMYIAALSGRASKSIINLGSSKKTTIKQAAETLIDVIGSWEIKYLEQRHEVTMAYSTDALSKDILDFKDSTPLDEGMRKMWRWAKEQPNRQVTKFPKYEIEKGIYSFWK